MVFISAMILINNRANTPCYLATLSFTNVVLYLVGIILERIFLSAWSLKNLIILDI